MIPLTTTRSGSRILAAALAPVLFFVISCSGESGRQADGDVVVHHYTTRGKITMLPVSADPASELQIHHEAIHQFKDKDGGAAPMNSMVMPFPPADDVSLAGFAKGDIVEIEFDVQWEPEPGMVMTSIRKLPADTELDFSNDHSAHTGGDHAHH